MDNIKVAAIVGSLRKDSISRKLAQALIGLAPEHLRIEIVEIGDLALFNEDLEAEPPPAWSRFRQQAAAADAFVFVTPEYNRSMPAVIKNAIDVGSRPPANSLWINKPALVVSQSPGALGGALANSHLRQSLSAVGVRTRLANQEIYLSHSAGLFNDDGALAKDETKAYLKGVLNDFAAWAALVG